MDEDYQVDDQELEIEGSGHEIDKGASSRAGLSRWSSARPKVAAPRASP